MTQGRSLSVDERRARGEARVPEVSYVRRGVQGGRWCNADLADYTADEVEFMMALDRYKREHNRPHPTDAEVLAVARGLGYHKPSEGENDEANSP